MSTYLSSLLTTTQRFRQLLPAGESDGDTTDDTHICRVLRAYYTEKGRAFPSWLPPDPKSAPAAALPGNNYGGGAGGTYGGMGAGGSGVGGQSKLSSLWDKPAEQAPAPQQPQSLRQNRTPLGGGLRRDGRGGTSSEEYARQPLPSQKAGSYQNASAPPLQSVASHESGGNRLKKQLFGGNRGATSPAPSAQAQNASSLKPQGNFGRQPSYETGRQDRLDGPSANQPWASGGDQYAPDPRRQQGGQRGYR